MLGEEARAPTPDVNSGKGAQAEGPDARVEAVTGEMHSPPRPDALKPSRPSRLADFAIVAAKVRQRLLTAIVPRSRDVGRWRPSFVPPGAGLRRMEWRMATTAECVG